jgi:hypothetical protein
MNAIDTALVAAILASSVKPSPKRHGCRLVAVAYGDDEVVQAAKDLRPRVPFVDKISTVADISA